MPDAFLRRVMAQRDAEQLGDSSRMAWLDEATKPRSCRVCGRTVRQVDALDEPAAVCTACGGRKKQAQLEQEDRGRAAANRRTDALLRLAGIHFNDEGRMGAEVEERNCAKCGKKLWANSKDECFRCRTGKTEGASPGPRTKSETKKRFCVVAEALGEDPEELLETFMAGWLSKIRGSVQRRTADFDDDL